MRPNPVTFTEEMLNGHLYAVSISKGHGKNLMLLKETSLTVLEISQSNLIFFSRSKLYKSLKKSMLNGTEYSRMYQVKFMEGRL